MIRINNISLPLDYDDDTLKKYAAKKLNISKTSIKNVSLYKRSTDARKKQNIHFEATIDAELFSDEERIASRCKNASIVKKYVYEIPNSKKLQNPPVVIGSGPCGLFAALILAQSGQCPIVIERGRDVDSRTKDVGQFWNNRVLDENSNVQFGEGGAGTFSDGKLNTGTKDSRIRKVLNEFVSHGAPEEILYLAKPHIGTDMLRTTVKSLREDIISLGGSFLFESKFNGLIQNDGKISGVIIKKSSGETKIETDNVVLAIGHSARDTFQMLAENSIPMSQKPFAMGVRIEHLQESINRQQYGDMYNSPYLSPADYKLAVHLKDGRGVFTFCMCPGGYVVAAASEKGMLATNGMSEFARDGVNANSALLVGINTSDFGSEDILAGVRLQRRLESAAFVFGGENYNAPVQRVGDFLSGKKTTSLGSVIPTYKPGVELTSLDTMLPGFMCNALRLGITELDKRLPGFGDSDAVLTAVESRSSSPVRIIRDDTMQSPALKGFYPCGEGAGYAGGIISAAVDGIKAAEMILKSSI